MSPEPEPGTPRPTILVAHDDPEVRDALARRLADAGHRAVTVRHGVKAAEMASRGGCDLVIAQRHLPRLDGMGLVTRLHALPDGGPAVVVLLDADDSTDPALLVGAGADDWLMLPVPDEVLVPRVAVAMRTAAARRAARGAAEQAGRDRDRLAGVVGAMLDGLLVIEQDGSISFASDRLCAMTGFARGEIEGARPPYPFWPMDRMQRIADALVRRLPDGEGEFDVDFRTRAGDDLPVIVGVSQEAGAGGAGGAFVVTVKDVSDRRRSEAEIAGLRRLYEGILNSAGEGIYGVDRRGWVTFANPAASAMLGWSVEELQGQSMHVFGSHTRADGTPYPVEEWLLSAAIGEGAAWRSDEEEFWRKDGTSFPVEYTSTPIREAGEIVGAVCCFSDITDRRHAEEEIRRQRDHAAALAGELEGQNATLHRQQDTLARLLTELSAEKGRVEIVYEFSQRLAQEAGVAAIAQETLRGFVNTVSAAVGAAYVALGGPGDGLTLAAARGGATEGLPRRIPVDGLALRALTTGHPAAALEGEDRIASADLGDATGELAVPLVHGGRAMGVVLLAWTEGTRVSTADLETLEHLSAPAAVALANARSYEDAERQAGITRAVLDATPDGICLVDRDGRIALRNPAFQAMHEGVTTTPGTPLLDVARGFSGRTADPAAYLARLEEIVAEPGLEALDDVDAPDTGRSYVRYTGPVRDAHGALLGRILVHRDVTPERQAERMKDEFVALASHELRSPLTSIRGYLDILSDGEAGPLGDEQAGVLGVVDRNARRLERLVDDLIVAAQAGAGRLSLVLSDADLAAVAHDAVEAARPVAEERGVRLAVAAPARAPLLADAGRLRQVVDNLVSNALKFTPSGGAVTVTVGTGPHGELTLEVADTGMGIAADELPRLFQRFYRTSGATREQVPGTGLGLAICKAIVEGHGGSVAVESTEGIGTTFRIVLPIHHGAAGARYGADTPGSAAA